MEMLTNAAIKAGLTGGIYIDFPNSKQAKKYYLVLSTVA
jgi:18S rRNA (guanine1575-N7)-methyltransferase